MKEDQPRTLALRAQHAFSGRAQAFVAHQLGRPVAVEDVVSLVGRGRLYGLTTEQDLVRYIFVAVAAGAGDGAPDPEWVLDILCGPEGVTAQDRLLRLFDGAARRLPHVVPGITGG